MRVRVRVRRVKQETRGQNRPRLRACKAYEEEGGAMLNQRGGMIKEQEGRGGREATVSEGNREGDQALGHADGRGKGYLE